MANVIFKRGSQSSLNNVARVDGQLLLTTDTNRLYADINTTGNTVVRQLLNQTVQIVSSMNDLPSYSTTSTAEAHINDFYYISGDNILAVFTRKTATSAPEWVQINPDTNTYIESVSLNATAANNVATITSSITDDNAGDSIADTMTITGQNGLQITADASGNITMSGDVYTLGKTVTDTTHASITLNSTNNATANTAVNILSADSNLTFSIEGNQLKATVKDTKIDSANLELPSNGTLSLVLTENGAGDTISATATNLGVIVGSTSGSYLPLADTTGKTAATIYTKTEVDNLINGLDGMTYKGTIGTGGTVTALPTTSVRNGDTYIIRDENLVLDWSKFSDATRSEGAHGVKVGDMIIASGVEGNDGYISNGLVWTYIPSGNDSLADVTYLGITTTSTNSLSLNTNNGDGDSVAGISISASTGINVISSATGSYGEHLITTISHEIYNTTTTAATTLSTHTPTFTAIKGLTISNGHVTAIETDTFTPDVYEFADVIGENSATQTTVQLGLNNAAGDTISTATLAYISDSIHLSAATATGALTMNIVWEEF